MSQQAIDGLGGRTGRIGYAEEIRKKSSSIASANVLLICASRVCRSRELGIRRAAAKVAARPLDKIAATAIGRIPAHKFGQSACACKEMEGIILFASILAVYIVS